MGTTLDIPIQTRLAAVDYGHEGMLKVIEKGLLMPMMSHVRAENEYEIYKEKNFLSMPAEQQAKEVRVERKGSAMCVLTFTEKPKTVSESKAQLQERQESAPTIEITEAAFKLGAVSKIVNASCDVYQVLKYYSNLINRLQAAEAALQAIEQDPFDLLRLPSIPQELHWDVQLTQHTCPITQLPIRNPVGDPNGITVYERSAIEKEIERSGRSPVTRLPLSVDQLIPRDDVRAQIEARLVFHSDRIRQIAGG